MGRNSTKELGSWTETTEECCFLACSPWLSLLSCTTQDYFFKSSTILSALGLPTSNQGNASQTCPQPVWWWQFLHCSSLFPNHSGLCQAKKKSLQCLNYADYQNKRICKCNYLVKKKGLNSLLGLKIPTIVGLKSSLVSEFRISPIPERPSSVLEIPPVSTLDISQAEASTLLCVSQ